MLPKTSPWGTVFWYFFPLAHDGTVDRIHTTLWDKIRDAAGRDPMASAGVIDAQSVKGADTVGADSRGFDAGKKVNGRNRHIVVDTLDCCWWSWPPPPASKTATAADACWNGCGS
jgi:hypothetical protein